MGWRVFDREVFMAIASGITIGDLPPGVRRGQADGERAGRDLARVVCRNLRGLERRSPAGFERQRLSDRYRLSQKKYSMTSFVFNG
jgi:hypothetical protein